MPGIGLVQSGIYKLGQHDIFIVVGKGQTVVRVGASAVVFNENGYHVQTPITEPVEGLPVEMAPPPPAKSWRRHLAGDDKDAS